MATMMGGLGYGLYSVTKVCVTGGPQPSDAMLADPNVVLAIHLPDDSTTHARTA